MEVPASVRLAGQDLVGHITDEAFVQTQPRLVQQDFPLQCAAAIGDGPSEAAGAFAAHLTKRWKNINTCVRFNSHKVWDMFEFHRNFEEF